MKKIFALLLLITSVGYSFARDYVVYEDDFDYLLDEEPDYVVYEEPQYIIEEPIYYVRKPVQKAKRTVIVHEEPCYVRYSNPGAAFFAGLAGFGVGAAIGSAMAD